MTSYPVPVVKVSWGELFDKISILELKVERVKDPDALIAVHREIEVLRAALPRDFETDPDLWHLMDQLRLINESLWDIEDELRLKEQLQTFDEEFIDLARSVYRTNDRRAALKRQINDLLGFELREVTQHPPY